MYICNPPFETQKRRGRVAVLQVLSQRPRDVESRRRAVVVVRRIVHRDRRWINWKPSRCTGFALIGRRHFDLVLIKQRTSRREERIVKAGSARVTDMGRTGKYGGKRLDERELVGWLRATTERLTRLKKRRMADQRRPQRSLVLREIHRPSLVKERSHTMSLENASRTFAVYKSAIRLTERKTLSVRYSR